jgi:hypothetical protein
LKLEERGIDEKDVDLVSVSDTIRVLKTKV